MRSVAVAVADALDSQITTARGSGRWATSILSSRRALANFPASSQAPLLLTAGKAAINCSA